MKFQFMSRKYHINDLNFENTEFKEFTDQVVL